MPQTSRAVLVAALLFGAAAAHAQQNPVPTDAKPVDEKAFKADAPGLYANADLSFVLTSGNSSSSSLGFKGASRTWPPAGSMRSSGCRSR